MVKRHRRQADGYYHIQGKGKFKLLRGTRAQVWHGTAWKTKGGLEKHQLIMNKNGRIVSKVKHDRAKKEKRLIRYGYGTVPGKFGAVRIGSKKGTVRRKRRRRARSAPGTRRVSIKEKRNIRSGRFSRGGRRSRRRRR